jgi:hypothetical protein
MYVSKWEKSNKIYICRGCDDEIAPLVSHLHAKFIVNSIDPKVNRLIVMRLCHQCIVDLKYSKTPQEIADDSL